MKINFETTKNYKPVKLKERTKLTSNKSFKEEDLDQLVLMAKPIIYEVNLDRASDDDDIKKFLKKDKNENSFFLMILDFSFSRIKDIIPLAIKIELSITDDIEEKVIFMSMDPSKIENLKEMENTNSGKVELGIIGGLLKIGLETTKKVTTKNNETFIIAKGERLNKANWIFTRTSQNDIYGDFRLKCIIKSPNGLKINGNIGVEAKIKKKLLHIIPYKSQFEEDSFSKFTLQ